MYSFIKSIKPPILGIICLFAAILVQYLFSYKRIIGQTWMFSGVMLLLIGLGLIVWCAGYFKSHKTTIFPHKKPSVLINFGPYKVSRNPIYIGMCLVLIGCTIFFGTLPFIFVPILFFWTINWIYIPFEEKNLEKSLGKTYLNYKKKVRRWL